MKKLFAILFATVVCIATIAPEKPAEAQVVYSVKCCDGNGCGIENIKKEELNVIIKEYLHLNSNNTVRDWSESKSEGTP